MNTRFGGMVLVAVAALAAVGCESDGPGGSATSEPVNTVPVTPVGGDEPLDREPDVTGVVAAGAGEPRAARFLAEPSDDYYDGMALAGRDGEPLVVGPDGGALSVTDLNGGDEIAVWIEGGCAESYPVQCDVIAIRVTQPAP